MTVPPQPFNLFISYAHKGGGEARKDRLLTALAPHKRNGLIETWHDRAIAAGDEWEEEINLAMADAHGAIFMLDEIFLASGFCMDKEVGTFLQRHRDDKVLILFVLADHCGWEEVDFIKKFQIVPRDNKPISKYRQKSEAYTAVVKEIANALRKHREEKGLPLRDMKLLEVAPSAPTFLSLSSLLAKLPGRTSQLFGREGELAQINAWSGHKGIFLWVADGGTGKSALVRWWLEQQAWPEGTRFVGHSFYSQGSHNQATSSRSFLLDALAQLAMPYDLDTRDDELGRLLAKAAREASTVLVLDGIEPLQQTSQDIKLNGTVKDCCLATLLEELARQPGECLCLAGSRLPIPDPGISDAPYFREKCLDLLPPPSAVALLRQRGVIGNDEQVYRMVERCGHHPLALVLAAEFCHTFLADQAANFLSREWRPKAGEAHAATVMAWFDSALADERQALDRELVRILGLFDRPAPWGVLLALKETEPPIPGLTETLHQAAEPAILESLARLGQWGLLQAELGQLTPELDAHPLVREYFGAILEQEAPDSFRAGHSVIFDWFCRLPDKDLPDTLVELEPLYRAVGHGCKAGRFRTALEEVFGRRIQRDTGYSFFQLGSYSSDLAALICFFPHGWEQPPVAATVGQLGESMSEADRSWLQAKVAFCLMSLGRLEEALRLRRLDRQTWQEVGNWDNFCRSSDCLADILTTLGRWAEAEAVSCEAAKATANIKGSEIRWQRRRACLAHMGRSMHAQGRLSDALTAFAEAEALQSKCESQTPKLYGPLGYYYTQLLLEQAGHEAGWLVVLERGRISLKIAEFVGQLLSQALDHGTIGCAAAALFEAEACSALDRAVATMQRASAIDDLPAIHLIRAKYRRETHQIPVAWADHDAALVIARRGNMRTYLADCSLLAGNLCLDENPIRLDEAAANHAKAAQLIREDGYGRRLTELHLLHARLLYAQHDPSAADALARAGARIREVGQWFFWRELRAVARELGVNDPGECPQPRAKKSKPKKTMLRKNRKKKR